MNAPNSLLIITNWKKNLGGKGASEKTAKLIFKALKA